MTAQVLALLAHDLTQPFFDPGVVHIVVIDPALIARVVRRINVAAGKEGSAVRFSDLRPAQ